MPPDLHETTEIYAWEARKLEAISLQTIVIIFFLSGRQPGSGKFGKKCVAESKEKILKKQTNCKARGNAECFVVVSF